MSQKSAHKLVEQVKTRLHLTWLGARWYQFVLYAAAAYALALVVLKLSGLAPAWVTWDQMGFWAVGAVPVLALIAALIFHRRPTCEDAAHAIDQRMQTKDLFLTDAMLDGAPGAFAPLVSEDAARQAPGIRPGTVVPYEWTNKTANAFAVLAVLALVMAFVPQFDLFGIHAEREHAQEIDKRLREQQAKAIQKKAEIRKAADRTALERAQTEIKLQQLEQTFRQMKRQDPKGNHEQLREQKKTIGELAAQKRKELDQDLKQGSKNPNNVRKFGSLLDSKARQFEDQLNKGEVGEVKEHIEQMKDKARQLAESSDPEEQQDLQRELQKMMDQLQQGLENGTSTEQLDQSVQDALDQMNMAGVEGMNAQQMQQAMESMQQSLGMAQQQLDNMSQQMKDMQQLDQALQAIQKAMNANQQQPLDGSDCEGCEGGGMAQYAKLYNEMMGQGGGGGGGGGDGGDPLLTRMESPGGGQGQGQDQGNGGGMGGPGTGQGGFAPYNDDAATDFKDELSKSKHNAGKLLMTWKTRELSKAGEAQKEYQEALQTVRQAADEALQNDDIPPGYHGPIGNYYGQGLEKDLDPQPVEGAE